MNTDSVSAIDPVFNTSPQLSLPVHTEPLDAHSKKRPNSKPGNRGPVHSALVEPQELAAKLEQLRPFWTNTATRTGTAPNVPIECVASFRDTYVLQRSPDMLLFVATLSVVGGPLDNRILLAEVPLTKKTIRRTKASLLRLGFTALEDILSKPLIGKQVRVTVGNPFGRRQIVEFVSLLNPSTDPPQSVAA